MKALTIEDIDRPGINNTIFTLTFKDPNLYQSILNAPDGTRLRVISKIKRKSILWFFRVRYVYKVEIMNKTYVNPTYLTKNSILTSYKSTIKIK